MGKTIDRYHKNEHNRQYAVQLFKKAYPWDKFYNTKRIHSHCDYMSPNDYEELYRRIRKDELLMAG